MKYILICSQVNLVLTGSELTFNISDTALLDLVDDGPAATMLENLTARDLEAENGRAGRGVHPLPQRLLQNHVADHPCAIRTDLPRQRLLLHKQNISILRAAHFLRTFCKWPQLFSFYYIEMRYKMINFDFSMRQMLPRMIFGKVPTFQEILL